MKASHAACRDFCRRTGPDDGGDPSSVRVFVYGTLRKGELRHHLLEHKRFLGEAIAEGFVLYDLGDYPGMVPGEGRVVGEVYEVSWEFLRTLDRVEGTPHLYRRETIEVCLESGQKLQGVFTYIYNGSTADYKIIKSGDWKRRERRSVVYYFAYGSNMNLKQMKERCGDKWRKVGIGYVEGYELVFDGYSSLWGGPTANIVENPAERVWGVLFELEGFESLDVREGYPKCYTRGKVAVHVSKTGQIVMAQTYIRPEPLKRGKPPRDYLDTIIRGARENGLPEDWIRRLEAHGSDE